MSTAFKFSRKTHQVLLRKITTNIFPNPPPFQQNTKRQDIKAQQFNSMQLKI